MAPGRKKKNPLTLENSGRWEPAWHWLSHLQVRKRGDGDNHRLLREMNQNPGILLPTYVTYLPT